VTATSDSATGSAAVSGGTLALGVSRVFTVNAGTKPIDLSVSAVISGAASLGVNTGAVAGSGALQLTGTSTYTGGTTVAGGSLYVDGPNGQIGSVTLTQGLLGGTGTVGAITATGGTIHPGDSGPGILTSTGGVSLASGVTFSVDINGTTAGSQYGQLNLAGQLNLGGATLAVNLGGFTPTTVPVETFTILHSSAGPLTSATFAQMGTIFVNGLKIGITYDGVGNNVILQRAKALTQTAITGESPVSPTTFGQVETFTATVTPEVSATFGFPSGSVSFFDGGTTLLGGAVVTNVAGVATAVFTTSPGELQGGSHSITAVYDVAAADPNFATSTSPAVAYVVTATSSTTTISGETPSGSSTFGQPVTFTATVGATYGAVEPTGTITFKDGTTTLGVRNLADMGGVATATLTTAVDTLIGGNHPISAVYTPAPTDKNYLPSSSTTVGYVVNRDPTTTTVTATPTSPSTFGDQVTFTAQVTPTVGNFEPTGTVTFKDGTNVLGVVALSDQSGIATAQVTTGVDELKGGTHTITATYLPAFTDPNYASSTSAGLSYTVNALTTVTTLTAAPASPQAFGQAVSLTATVTPTVVTTAPTGTVEFFDFFNGVNTPLAIKPLVNAAGTATATYTTNVDQLTGGGHMLTAQYLPGTDLNFAGSTSSPAIGYTINARATTTSLSSMPASPSVFGQPVTFSATVTPTIGAFEPTGTVTFLDNGTPLGAAVSLADLGGIATATFTTGATQLLGGSHQISATYTPDNPATPNFLGSSSATSTFLVNRAATTTAITAASPSTSTFGDAVTFTAQVTQALGGIEPTGTVAFLDGGTNLGSVQLADMGGIATATFSTSATQLSGGTHQITAMYTPAAADQNYAASTSSPALSYTVSAHASTTTITAASPAATAVFGTTVMFTATVTPNVLGVEPAGTVQFMDGGTLLGSAPLADMGGVATARFAASPGLLTGGGHTISATYVPGSPPNFAASTSAGVSYTISKATSTTTITGTTPAAPAFGEAVTLTATVTPTYGTVEPTGTVTFMEGTTTIGTGTLADAGGTATATVTTTTLAVGGHTITAVYAPGTDPNYNGSTSADFNLNVARTKTTTVITAASPNSPSTFGQVVTFTATVTPEFGTLEPAGTVTFMDGTMVLGSNPLGDVNGTATAKFSTTAVQLTGGSHTITAVFAPPAGDPNFGGSTSANFTYVVQGAGTDTAITGATPGTSSTFGDVVTFTATVTPALSGIEPTGSVTFKDGGMTLGSGTLVDAGGTATAAFSTTATQLSGGAHTITAVYAPGSDLNYATSTSAGFAFTVNRATTTATVTQASPASPAPFGTAVMFTATVTSAVAGAEPTGTVTFKDNGNVVATANLGNLGGTATATFTTTATQLAVGGHTITAEYAPGSDPNFAASTSGDFGFTVSKAGTTTTVTQASPASPSTFGQQVTFTATVTASVSGVLPTGTVTFLDGGNMLGSGTLAGAGGIATATFTTGATQLPGGGHTITAVYNPGTDPDFVTSTSAGFGYTVSRAATTATVTQASPASPAAFGTAVTFTATVTSAVAGVEPAGTVTFLDGGNTLGSGTLADAGGTATATFTTALTQLTVAGHTITAVYAPGSDPDFAASTSAGFGYTVTRAATTTAVTGASPTGSSIFGTQVTFTATVAPTIGGVEPTGTVTFMNGAATLGSGTLTDVSGVATATFATSAVQLLGGSHTITAVYVPGSDPNFLASTSGGFSYTVNPANTTTTITQESPPGASTFGQQVTFTATVTPTLGGIDPTGTVSFFDGSTFLGSGNLADAGGKATATFMTSVVQLGGGGHSIHATYNPGTDPNFATSTSANLSYTVGASSTTTTVTGASAASPEFGQPVTFTATVTPAPGGVEPTGMVNFFDGTTPLGSGTLADAGGKATATVTTSAIQLGVGGHTITAVYAPGADPNFLASTSAGFGYTVTRAATTTAVVQATPAGSSSFGQQVRFVATVTPTLSGIEPTGMVTFKDGATPLGTVPLQDVAGTATASFSTTAAQLSGGGHTITAVYVPGTDPNFGASTSGGLSYTVNPAATTTVVQASPPGPSVFGQVVTFTAQVTPTVGTVEPTGTVTFLDGSTPLSTVSLADQGGTATATFATTATQLAGGGHTITAVYAPGSDPNFQGSASGGLSYSVTPTATVTTLAQATPPSPSTFGQQVTLLATVTPNVAGIEPAGTVTFEDAGNFLGVATLQDAGGVATATFTTSAGQLAGGGHTLSAVYDPGSDPDFQGSTSADFAYTVNKAATTAAVTVATPVSPSTFGQQVTFTAAVMPTLGGVEPTGTVTFLDGATPLGSGTLHDAAGKAVASFTTTAVQLTGGGHTITAVYAPGNDPNYQGSSSARFPYTVNAAATTTAVTGASPAGPSVFGTAVTFTVTVTSAVSGVEPTGSVTFKDGTAVLGTVALQDAGGTATALLPTSATQLAGGVHAISAVYNPGADTNYATSTAAPFSYTLTAAATTTTITGASAASNTFGQAVTFTATVTPSFGGVEPTGTVTFSDGNNVLGTGTVHDAGGTATATLTTSPSQLLGGVHVITAVYAPARTDANYQGSSSTAFDYTVTPSATTTTVAQASPPSQSTFGQAVTFTAQVTPSVAGIEPTGTVTFQDGGNFLGTGTLVDAGGTATATITTTATQLGVGNHTITAIYAPGNDPNFQGSTSAGFGYAVGPAPTTTTVQASPASPSTFGQAVTLTATVTPTVAGIVPTGTVSFKDGTTFLGTETLQNQGGTATATLALTTAQVPGGVHAFSAVFTPDAADTIYKTSTAAPVSYTVSPATATTNVTASSTSPQFGQQVTFTATVTPALGGVLPTGSVTFKDGGNVLGSGTLTNVGGTATATFTAQGGALAVGGQTVTAVYVPGTDPNYQAGTAGSVSLTVGAATTTTTVTQASPPAPTFGQPVTLTAMVTPTVAGTEPTGTVTFEEGTTVLGSGTLADVGGTATATFTTAATQLGAGNHGITAVYAPNGNPSFQTSTSAMFGLSVAQVGTTTVLASTAPNAVVGQAVITATVTAANPGAGAPTGSVVFSINNGSSTSNVTVALVGNTATLNSVLDVGTYTIGATYQGAANFAGSTAAGSLSQVVTSASTNLTLSVAPTGPVSFGQPVTFTAAVAAVPPGAGVPTGNVTFNVDGTLVTRPLDNTGHATLTLVLGGGSHSVTASYGSTPDFLGSTASAPVQPVVAPTGSTTTLSVVPTSVFSGQPVTLTATVTGVPAGVGAPAGTVTFFDGSTPLGTVALSGGQASLTTTQLGAGAHSLHAVYSGDADFTVSSGSAALTNLGQPIVASVTRVGRRPQVQVFNTAGHTLRFSIFPYGKSFHGPVRVVLGDVNGDGFPDVIVVPGRGPAEPVLTFDGRTGAPLGRIRVGPLASKGIFVTAGDVNGDGKAEVLLGVGPLVRGYDGTTGSLLFQLAPFGRKSPRTVRVAAVDVNGDGIDEVVAVLGSKVAGFDGRTLAPVPASELTPFLGQITAQVS
jgi:hypothetical protein